MKFVEINKRYTEIVAEYMAKGYTINAGTMGGSQGEIANIDLTDGNEVIRVLVTKGYEHDENWNTFDYCQIIVGKCTDKVKINSSDTWDTIWNEHLEIIACEKFYVIGNDRKTGMEFGTKEEAKLANEKRSQRFRGFRNDKVDMTDKALEIGKRIVKRVWNKEKVRTADIKVVKGKDGYYVQYNNKYYTLH